MLLSAANLHRLQSDGLTIVDLLVASVLNNVAVDWPRFVVGGVSDVDEARLLDMADRLGNVLIEFQAGADLAKALEDVRSKVSQAKRDLPDGTARVILEGLHRGFVEAPHHGRRGAGRVWVRAG